MIPFVSRLFTILLGLTTLGYVIFSICSKKREQKWSPLTVISLTLFYYCVYPLFLPEIQSFEKTSSEGIIHIAALIYFLCIILGFNLGRKTTNWKHWNKTFNSNNAGKLGITLFIIALACYVPFRGFRYTIDVDDVTVFRERTGFVSYFIDLISMFCMSNCLLIAKGNINRKYRVVWLVVFWLSLVTFIVCGFRSRIVILLIALFTTYYLFPVPKKVNYWFIACVGIVAIVGFSIMEKTRQYGKGINMEDAKEIGINDVQQGPSEAGNVYRFSSLVIDYCYQTEDYVYFEPVIGAILMPIPRALFPQKPNGDYLKRYQFYILGEPESGSAFLSFVEGFASFGWLGLIIYGLLLGLLSSLFWNNYLNNPQSIAAIVSLAVYNGWVYKFMSRGYLPSSFNSFMYYIVIPIWLSMIIRLVTNKGISR